MITERQIPAFFSTDWYSDHNDHRCPHDAWLEGLEITEPAEGERNERRRTDVTVRLLAAYHDGHIMLRYSGVKNYSMLSESCVRGLGDWLGDEVSITKDGALSHRITWCFGPDK